MLDLRLGLLVQRSGLGEIVVGSGLALLVIADQVIALVEFLNRVRVQIVGTVDVPVEAAADGGNDGNENQRVDHEPQIDPGHQALDAAHG